MGRFTPRFSRRRHRGGALKAGKKFEFPETSKWSKIHS
jgi:hypothetical protein